MVKPRAVYPKEGKWSSHKNGKLVAWKECNCVEAKLERLAGDRVHGAYKDISLGTRRDAPYRCSKTDEVVDV